MAVERFPVEASHIMMFARAVADANPIYYDADYAAGTEVGAIIAPPLVSWLVLSYGWRMSFVIVGLLGYGWLVGWWLAQRTATPAAAL